jgi:hypothetical protein
MRSLLSGRPHVVYKTAYYRKQTKNHWARDDPAFCVLQAAFLIIASVVYSIAFRTTLSGFLSFLLHSLLWNWLVPGVVVASVAREVANRHLNGIQSANHVKQTVEWLYAFDIHCNAFFPLFCLLCEYIVPCEYPAQVWYLLTILIASNRRGAILFAAPGTGTNLGGPPRF